MARSTERRSATKKTVRRPPVAKPAAPTEAELWAPREVQAAAALKFWQSFMQWRKSANKVTLDAEDLRRLLLTVRAVSWVESRHGTGVGNQPARDPMQCGNPRDVWWKQLAGSATAFDRFVGGPGASNYDANELPEEAAKAGLPESAKLFTLTNVDQGHKDAAFNSAMSYYWGVPHLIWKTNCPRQRPFYWFSEVSRAELVAGAKAYNGGGDSSYESKIDQALTNAGWPPSASLEAPPELPREDMAQALAATLDTLEAHTGPGRLFPQGIVRLKIELQPGSAALASVEVSVASEGEAAERG